jgi:hypothetical protein
VDDIRSSNHTAHTSSTTFSSTYTASILLCSLGRIRKEVICYSLAQTSTEIVMHPWATRSTRSQLSSNDTQSCLATLSGQETRCPLQTASQIIAVSRQNWLTLEMFGKWSFPQTYPRTASPQVDRQHSTTFVPHIQNLFNCVGRILARYNYTCHYTAHTNCPGQSKDSARV